MSAIPKLVLVACSALVAAGWQNSRPVAALPSGEGAAASMESAARKFLGLLGEEQRKKAQFELQSSEREKWGFVPNVYPGIGVFELSAAQRDAAHALLRSTLSAKGYLATTAIFSLDGILREMERTRGREAPHRDPERYFFAVFGDPSGTSPWGWRVQGHHVSLHFSSVEGAVSVTPLFLGANPANVREGTMTGLRVLASEEDLGRALVKSLDEKQRKRATLQAEAPADVILGPGRAADFLGEPKGLPGVEMNSAQREVLAALLDLYTATLRADLAQGERIRMTARGLDEIYFSWAGGTEPGQGHYYRIHGPEFVLEYDNTQDGANHVHTVWRDRRRDFGQDLLAEHLRRHPR